MGRGAKPGERNIIELEASAPDGELVTHTIASLTVGVQEMVRIQLAFLFSTFTYVVMSIAVSH